MSSDAPMIDIRPPWMAEVLFWPKAPTVGASLHGCNQLEQCRSNCRGAKKQPVRSEHKKGTVKMPIELKNYHTYFFFFFLIASDFSNAALAFLSQPRRNLFAATSRLLASRAVAFSLFLVNLISVFRSVNS
jgi:hypothetical protein